MSTKLTIVTGSVRGIKAKISRRLAAQNHDVVITDRQDRFAAEAVTEEVRRSGHGALTAPVETIDPGSIAELFDRGSAFGPPTELVNKTGPLRRWARWSQ